MLKIVALDPDAPHHIYNDLNVPVPYRRVYRSLLRSNIAELVVTKRQVPIAMGMTRRYTCI